MRFIRNLYQNFKSDSRYSYYGKTTISNYIFISLINGYKNFQDGITILKQSKIAHAVSLTAAMVTAPAFPESAVKGSKR